MEGDRGVRHSWIDPWVKDSPDPVEFTNQINSLATVARQLYVGNAPAPGSSGSAPTSADLDLWDALSELDISVDNTSVAIDLFQRNYATDISRESHRVAEWLIELLIDFKDTDAGIAERNRTLRELAGEIDDYELARGNDPHHPSSIS